MGWFDFLFRPPTRDKFAALVMADLRKAAGGKPLAMKYDPEHFLIERGSDGFINLANLYHEYCQAPRNHRKTILSRFLIGCLGTPQFELPEEFDDVHPDLLPVVRSRFYLESIVLQSRIRGGEGLAVPQQPIGDHLALSLVYDLPQAMRSITQENLDQWGVTLYEAVEGARHNLEQMHKVSFASVQNEGGDGVYISMTNDHYDASRIVLLDLVRKMSVRGDPVAMVPNRDTLILAGSDDPSGLALMCKIADDAYEKPRPISTVALRLVDDEWESWLPEDSSPAFARLHDLRLRTVGMEYNHQKEMLDQIHQHRGEDVFVANFSAIQHKETGRITSYSVWSEGVATLLPETDELLLLRPDPSSDQVEVVASGSFERVRDIVGDLMQPQGDYPQRYRVLEFPSEQQLASIGKNDWPSF